MNGEDIPEHNDSRTKKKQIQRSKAISDLQSKLPSGEKLPSCANLDELKSPDKLKSHKTGNQCGSFTESQSEQKNLTLQISVSTVGDEGYSSTRPSGTISILSSCPSRSSIKSTSSTSNIPPPQILEDDENSKPITFDCQCDSDSKDHPFPQNEESETLIAKLTLLELADTEPHGRESLQTQSASLPPRRHSYQHICPLSSQRDCHRRSSLLTGGRPTVITFKMLPSQSVERPTGRRNSQQLASRPAPKRKLPSTRSYIFKATPLRRYNSEIFTVKSTSPDWVATPKLRRMSTKISEFAKNFESAKQGGEMQSDVGTSTTGSIKTADSESAMRVGKIQLEDEFTGTSTTGSIKTAGYLRGAEVVCEIGLLITNEATTFLWEGCGFKLNVPRNSLPEDVSEYPVNIKASLTGHFELPEGLELVSAVYWVYVPGQFIKPVTIEIQHCANFSSPSQLHFIRASCTQKSLPFKFKVVDGGSFTLGSKYGALFTTKFSGNGIAKEVEPGEHSCQYCAQVYFTVKHLQDFWYCHFVVTKDIDMCLAVVQRKYQQEYDIAPPITFANDHIALDIPEDGAETSNGWRIVPQYIPMIKKERVNNFSSEQSWVPECVLLLEWLHKEKNPDQLEYKVKMQGAKEEKAFFRIFFHPENFLRQQSSKSRSLLPGKQRSRSETSDEHSLITTPLPTDIAILNEKPRLAQLTILKTTKGRVQIIDSIAHRWKRLGILMDFDDDGNKVDLIENEYKQDGPVVCCQEVFKIWLKGTHATWRNLIDLLNDCEMGELVQEIRNALGLPSA